MTTSRLEAFSDGVFGIAITLLVLEIRVPESTRNLLHELAVLWPSYLGYAISFLVIGLIWANHHAMFVHIGTVNRTLMFANTLLLMSVALIPFTAAVLASAFRSGNGQRTAVVLYGGTLVVGGLLFNWIWAHARRDHHLLDSNISAVQARSMGQRFMLGPALYLVGTLLGAIQPIVGTGVFALLILFYWLPITAGSRKAV
ncbi:TMEM175 family protein [Paenarthrobacter nicotinovorans]|uniref:TMEM175 family protein n=1 Tax=Paenarthrobacter nicotinovorans TaxID=29320 RepID=UPI0011AB05EE|nr:TMEM175 family protein [Paenarthrobacter nicotinovorans]